MNGIFVAGDGVLLRVSLPTAPPEQAVWLGRLLARCGLRVPAYLHDEPFAVDGHAVFAIAAVVEEGPVDWAGVGHMIARLHLIDPGEVARGYPLPFCGDFPWWDFSAVMNEVSGDLDRRSHAAISAAIARCRPLLDQQRAGDLVVCHGDVHPGNVIQSEQGPVLLDWDLTCRGPAAWDHAPLMTWTERWGGEDGIYEAFAAGYGRSLRGEADAEAIAELRLVAATLMRVRATRSNPSAAAEAELRLRYWRGEVDAPAWHAQ
jgi:Ser/Thr protein kinase RdoA (MazF antagonist)